MTEQLIDRGTGRFTVDESFGVSSSTTLADLRAHYGEELLRESDFVKDCYLASQVRLGALYFTFCFYMVQDRLHKISFAIDATPGARDPWSSNRDVETAWIATQLGDSSGFVWDMSKAGRHYHLSFPWGSIGVYYDFKNGTFESLLIYLQT